MVDGVCTHLPVFTPTGCAGTQEGELCLVPIGDTCPEMTLLDPQTGTCRADLDQIVAASMLT
jgi:hypothetical protein